MTKKFILWDHDGVLVDTEKWYYEANKRALAELNIVIDFKQYMEFMQIGKSVWTIPREKGIDENLVLKAREHRDQYYQDYLQTKNIEIPHVEEVLKNLSKKYLMCIVTTAKKKDFDLIHKNRKIMDHMQFALTLGEYKRSKPHPDPYLTALEKFGGKKEEAVVVEDSARGLKAAIAAGIECTIVCNEFTKSHDFTGATKILNSIQEMKPPRSKLRGITRKGIVCETPRFLTLFPLQGNLEASFEESPD